MEPTLFGLDPQSPVGIAVFLFFTVWSLFWTGISLWYAGRRGDTWWFILFLIVHTAGLLETVYLFYVAKLPVTILRFGKSVAIKRKK